MKNLHLIESGILVFFGMFILTFPVFADSTPTVTPGPGFESTQYLPTGVDNAILCPDSTPEDWLTVTPGDVWNFYCMACSMKYSTSTPVPEPTWNGTGTAPTTITPTIEITPTIQGTPIYSGPALANWISEPGGGPATGVMPFTKSGYGLQAQDGAWTGTIDVLADLTYVHADYEFNTLYNYIKIANNTPNEIVVNYNVVEPYSTYSLQVDNFPPAAGGHVTNINYEQTFVISGTGGFNAGAGNVSLSVQEDGYGGYYDDGSSMTINAPAATPMPTTLPEPTTTATLQYCAKVSAGSPASNNVFNMSGLIKEAGSCLDIGPYNANLLGIELNVPALVHVCLYGISFGSMSILGITFSMDVLMLVVAGIWAIRTLVMA
ncbi:MAG TPA: hypothetical protein VMR41_05145 [Patescibacteria group bacterium]|jgi:hypothetical protein|nr:hypothetical protein [Patescibacteria group bacterium]